MNAIDAHAQPFNGQRRQQRHPQDDYNQTYDTMPATGNVFMPDSRGTFTFSAEPSSMIYDNTVHSMSTSNTPGQDTVFTPNVGSSIDSSLHPDIISYSYPPLNNYQNVQNYGLSPGSYHSNSQNISPSHSVEHLSPDAGYMSDPSNHDYSAYATPQFTAQPLDESLANFNLNDSNALNGFIPYQGQLNTGILTAGSLNMFNAQPATLPVNTHQQLLSPSATHDSSPVVGEEVSTFPAMQYTQTYQNSTPPNRIARIPQSTPIKQVQSPALTNSPGNAHFMQPQTLVRHLTSPIVRVENYSREDSPSRSDNSRPVSKRSYGSRRSANHLSPYQHDDSSEDEHDVHEQHQTRHNIPSQERKEDGSWLASNSSGQAGLSPADRQAMGDTEVPSLEEIAEKRVQHEKKLEIKEWLTKSEIGSEAGDVQPSNSLLVPHVGRRRAKSTNDLHRRHTPNSFGLDVRTDFDRYDDTGIPGPGVYIDARSEFDEYEDDDDDVSAEPESPPATVDIRSIHEDNSYFPPAKEPISNLGTIVRPWVDTPSQGSTSGARYQPPTSNAAMMRFRLRAKDVESASLAATVGSRRLSESDLGSLRAAPGVAKLIEPDPKKQKDRQRRPSFLENILPPRTPRNLLKRKGSIPVPQPTEAIPERPKDPPIAKPNRIGSWGKSKSPRVDTNLSNHSRDGVPTSSSGLNPNSEPWYQGAIKGIRRSRSRSDIGKSPGLSELMTRHGGPPMPMLASPLAETEATKASAQPSPADDDDDDEQEPVTMNLEVRSDPIIPTYEGFRTHTRQLNPRLTDIVVERITQEQMRRYKRLLDFKVKHMKAVQNKSCASGKLCPELGGEARQLPPKAGNKDSDTPAAGFVIAGNGSSDDDNGGVSDGAVMSNPFPPGVPAPPVKRLPAEFECPLCFKVKRFYKPSDWTKHVHEDVQPFTCTFPNCGEPKSFKRKADWVRHENERHRQLENWTCQIADCNHTCYRKDNFVQHLVREHKIAEPKQRTGRKDAAQAGEEGIWALVERCRRDTTKQPKDEPCRFCGNLCTTWKKLTVHLARHMQQISLPILPLIEQKPLTADSIISPVVEVSENCKLSVSPSRSPVDNSSRFPASALAPGIDPYSQFPQDAKPEVAANSMHTYPPPQMVPYKNQQPAQVNGYANYAVTNGQTYLSQTYPGLQQPSKPQNGYVNGLRIPNEQFQNGQFGGLGAVSSVQQQAIYTDSPIDTTAFPNYFVQDGSSLNPGMPNMGYDNNNAMQRPQQQQNEHQHASGTYQAMAYLNPQHNYQYQGH